MQQQMHACAQFPTLLIKIQLYLVLYGPGRFFGALLIVHKRYQFFFYDGTQLIIELTSIKRIIDNIPYLLYFIICNGMFEFTGMLRLIFSKTFYSKIISFFVYYIRAPFCQLFCISSDSRYFMNSQHSSLYFVLLFIYMFRP